MRQIIFALSLFVFLFGFEAVSYVPAPVYACVNWGEPQCAPGAENPDGSCARYETSCLDDNTYPRNCDSGYYSCNRADTDPSGHYFCCQVGSGGGGGVGYACDWGQVDCPPGQVINPTSYSTYCGLNTGCPRPGTAQSRIAPGCGGTFCGDRECWINQNGVEKCKCNEWLYRRQTIRTYGCMPIVSACSATSPSAPTLASPAGGASLASTDTTLLWNASSSWGTGCPANNNQYQVFVSTTNPPPTTTPYSTVADTQTSEMYAGINPPRATRTKSASAD